MKIVNPVGRMPLAGDFSVIVPRTCICNSGAHDILESFGGNSSCACQCKDNSSANENANHSMSYGYNH